MVLVRHCKFKSCVILGSMNRFEIKKLLALHLPFELADKITGYITPGDIKKPKDDFEIVYIPKFRVRHRYLRQLMSF